MKFRMKERKEVRRWEGLDRYSADTAYYVQGRFAFVFWFTLASFWDKDMAESYLKAMEDCAKK